MPIDYNDYPDNWKQISDSIRFERAKGRCEQCGVAHGSEIVRGSSDPAQFIVWDAEHEGYRTASGQPIRLSEIPGEYDISRRHTKIVLTVHHIGIDKPDGTPGDPHDKHDVRPENLAALCQRCHLLADLALHMDNARQTRAAKRQAKIKDSGQMELF